MGQLIQATAGIELYGLVVADVEKQKIKALKIYNEYKKHMEDKKYLATLSMPEHSALGQNELNYKRLLKSMDEVISTLIAQKWTNDVQIALFQLDDAVLLIKDVLAGAYDLDELGKEIYAKQLVSEKKYAAADYIGRIAIVQTMIDILREDILEDSELGTRIGHAPFVKFLISTNLGKAHIVLQRELENAEANGPPQLHQFEFPEEVVPEIPDIAPDPQEKVLEVVE